jgi:hypothetical protein
MVAYTTFIDIKNTGPRQWRWYFGEISLIFFLWFYIQLSPMKKNIGPHQWRRYFSEILPIFSYVVIFHIPYPRKIVGGHHLISSGCEHGNTSELVQLLLPVLKVYLMPSASLCAWKFGTLFAKNKKQFGTLLLVVFRSETDLTVSPWQCRTMVLIYTWMAMTNDAAHHQYRQVSQTIITIGYSSSQSLSRHFKKWR